MYRIQQERKPLAKVFRVLNDADANGFHGRFEGAPQYREDNNPHQRAGDEKFDLWLHHITKMACRTRIGEFRATIRRAGQAARPISIRRMSSVLQGKTAGAGDAHCRNRPGSIAPSSRRSPSAGGTPRANMRSHLDLIQPGARQRLWSRIARRLLDEADRDRPVHSRKAGTRRIAPSFTRLPAYLPRKYAGRQTIESV